MRLRSGIGVAAVLAACAAARVVGSPIIALAQSTQSQWDGVYTLEQARRGEKLYVEKCATCHGSDMTGGEMAPGLTGSAFTTNWNNLTLGDLLDRMRISMPLNAPGTLSRQDNADILASMLNTANYPPGKTELPTQSETLKAFKFLAQKPAQ